MKKIEWKICGKEFRLNYNIKQYYDIRRIYENRISYEQRAIRSYYKKNVNSYDDIFENALPYYLNRISHAIEDSVELLIDFGILRFDNDTLASVFANNFDLEDSLDYILDIDRTMSDELAKLIDYRKQQATNRSRWVGGGFGVKGAIAGVLTAGILNAGTSVMKGATTSCLRMTDKIAIKGAKSKIYNDYSDNIINTFEYSFNEALMELFNTVYYIFIRELGYPEVEFEYDTYIPMAKNIRRLFKQGKLNKTDAITKLISIKELIPYHMWIDYFIYEIDNSSKKAIIDIGNYLGYGENLRENLEYKYLDDDCRWHTYPNGITGDSIVSLEKYQEDIEKICLKFAGQHNYEVFNDKLIVNLGIRKDSKCYLVHDDSLFRNGKCGFAITSDGFFIRESFAEREFMSWNDFKKIPEKDISFRDENKMYIAAGRKNITYYTGCDHKDELLEMVISIHQLLNNKEIKK